MKIITVIITVLETISRTCWQTGRFLGRILGRCLRALAKALVILIVVYALFAVVPELKELMPASAKLLEVILSAFDKFLMSLPFMAHWF